MADIDYKELLKKYMLVVYSAEGGNYTSIYYIEDARIPGTDERVFMTQDEIEELDRIVKELGIAT